METKEITVDASGGARLDVYLASRLEDVSRSYIQKLIADGFVSVNGLTPRAGTKVAEGDEISVTFADPVPADILPEDIPLDIRYDDDHIMVINKPKGMTVHPAPGSPTGTLVNAILACGCSLSSIGGVERPGIVHRIDKDTSGLLVVAKTDAAHARLSEAIKVHDVKRKYIAILCGRITSFTKSKVDAPIGRDPEDRQRMAVIRDPEKYTARNAVTYFEVKEKFRSLTMVEASLETGRTHQIRVHAKFMGYPVLGDMLYNRGRLKNVYAPYNKLEQRELMPLIENLHGQALHAHTLDFAHPITGESMHFEVPLPPDMTALIDWLRAKG